MYLRNSQYHSQPLSTLERKIFDAIQTLYPVREQTIFSPSMKQEIDQAKRKLPDLLKRWNQSTEPCLLLHKIVEMQDIELLTFAMIKLKDYQFRLKKALIQQDKSGNTPLHVAVLAMNIIHEIPARANQVQFINNLIAFAPDALNVVNNQQQTPKSMLDRHNAVSHLYSTSENQHDEPTKSKINPSSSANLGIIRRSW